MPGLADLHGHLSSRRQWPLWLAHGITTVRDMWGAPMQLAWRDEVAAGVAVGPRIVCASPYLDGPLPGGGARYPGVEPVADPDAAAASARVHAAAGYDAVERTVAAGRTAPLFVGDGALPRHVVLAVGREDDALLLYEPASGNVVRLPRAQYVDGGFVIAGWGVPWAVVVPR